MKKTISLLLALIMVLSLTIFASADDGNTTTLTTTVPPAAYTLHIPENQTITYAATSTDIGNVTVTDSSGFATSKNLVVTVTYGSFTSETVTTTLPFSLWLTPYGGTTNLNEKYLSSGGSLVFKGSTSYGTVSNTATALFKGKTSSSEQEKSVTSISVKIDSSAWGKALAGDYTATITFTAEVVVEETT